MVWRRILVIRQIQIYVAFLSRIITFRKSQTLIDKRIRLSFLIRIFQLQTLIPIIIHQFHSHLNGQTFFSEFIIHCQKRSYMSSQIRNRPNPLNIKELIIMQNDQAVPVVLEKGLVFKEYSSLELSTRDKFIKRIREQGYSKPQILWTASEKIHGSNFSIHFNGEFVRYGRRTDFLTKDIPVPCNNPGEYFNESFYDARNLVARFHNNLPEVFESIKHHDPKLLKFSIYGEFFGGNWPAGHPQAIKNGPKMVQKGVYYTPNNEFFAFDIFVTTSESAYWADVEDIPKLLKGVIQSVPVYVKGTFDEVFGVNIQIDSTIPELLGLEKLEKNLIEGMVIRPNRNLTLLPHNQRVIIKKKNKEFVEKASEPNPAKKEKKDKVIDPEIAPFYEELLRYLNTNRIDSVVSKFPDLKDRNKLRELVTADILADAEKDEVKLPPTEDKKKELLKEFNTAVLKEINAYFVKH